MTLESCPKLIFTNERLEGIAKRELNLPRVEGGARRPVIRVWRSFQEALRSASLCRWIKRAEISRAVHGVEEPNVDCVQQVESFGDELDFLILMDIESPREAQVHGLQAVAPEGVARFDSHTVVVSENVAVGIEAGELGEMLRRLQSENEPHLEVAPRHAPSMRSLRSCVGHKA